MAAWLSYHVAGACRRKRNFPAMQDPEGTQSTPILTGDLKKWAIETTLICELLAQYSEIQPRYGVLMQEFCDIDQGLMKVHISVRMRMLHSLAVIALKIDKQLNIYFK